MFIIVCTFDVYFHVLERKILGSFFLPSLSIARDIATLGSVGLDLGSEEYHRYFVEFPGLQDYRTLR